MYILQELMYDCVSCKSQCKKQTLSNHHPYTLLRVITIEPQAKALSNNLSSAVLRQLNFITLVTVQG